VDIETIFETPIAFHRSLVHLTGSITAALMLGQAWYWTARTQDPDGWFYKSADEWQEEIAMTRREQEGARVKLRELGFWKEERRGIPCQLYFRIDKTAFRSFLKACPGGNLIRQKGKTGQPKSGNPASTKSEIYKESEITSKTISTKESASFVLPDWIPQEAWMGFEEMRKKIRKPLTDRAKRLTISTLTKLKRQGHDPIACLDQSTQRAWQGVFTVREDDSPQGQIFERHDSALTGQRLIEQYKAENARLELKQRMMDGINNVGTTGQQAAEPPTNC